MVSYNSFYKFYDAVMGDRSRSAKHVKKLITNYHPKARTLLELACGTGSVLSHLQDKYKVAGLDLSNQMLSIAKKKLPKVSLYHQSMIDFEIEEKFDVIICVFDSINHLLKFTEWKQLFARAVSHLVPGGLFIFDMNTERKLARHILESPWVKKIGEHIMIMDVQDDGQGIANWNIKVFEHKRGTEYQLLEENIREVSFSPKNIQEALLSKFKWVKILDLDRSRISKKSDRLYFICQK